MATYTRKKEKVEAVQWTKDGDHTAIKALSVTGAKANQICTSCGQPMSAHGMRDLGDLYDTICPGWWILTGDSGQIEYIKTTTLFETRYEKDKTV